LLLAYTTIVVVVADGAANTVMIMSGFVTINFLETCRFGMALAWSGSGSVLGLEWTWTLHNSQQLAS